MIEYDELATFHSISHLLFRPSAPSACSFPVTARRAGLLFLISALIDQNYCAVVVILIKCKSTTETDIFL